MAKITKMKTSKPSKKANKKSKSVKVKLAKPGNVIGKSSKAQEERWQAESDLDTMMRVSDIKKDKQRMTRVKLLKKERMVALKKV